MVLLDIDNSVAKLSNLTIEQHKSIKAILSYQIKTYPVQKYSHRQSLLSKDGSFPTGLLYPVKKYLLENNIPTTVNDIRRAPKPQQGLFKLSLDYLPYEEQTQACEAAIRFKRGIISCPTAFGKSTIIALIINELQVPTLVVVPTLELKRQLTETLCQVFGFKTLPKYLKVTNIDSAKRRKNDNFDCVIIDEFHHSGATTYRKLNKSDWGGIYYRFGLTATPFRSQDNERLLLESVLAHLIYKVTYETAVNKGYIAPLEAYYYEIPKCTPDGYSWAEIYSELIVNNKIRNDIISKILTLLKDNHTLCLVKEIKHGNLIADSSNLPFASGENDNSRELIKSFSKGDLTTLVSTTGIMGEGIDTKPAEFVIIAGLGKSKNAFMQQVGRVLRKYPNKDSGKVILFLDRSHRWTKDHFKMQCKILKEEYGITPVKLLTEVL